MQNKHAAGVSCHAAQHGSKLALCSPVSSVLHIPSNVSSSVFRNYAWFRLATSTSIIDTAAHNVCSVQKREGYTQ